MERESVRKDKGEEKRGTVGQETRRKWWEGVDGHAKKKKTKKNTGTIRQMKKQDLGYREEKMAERRRRKQSNL